MTPRITPSAMDIRLTYPEYATTAALDRLRATEYGFLDEQDHVYLDYTGASLAARAQHAAHAQRCADSVLGNPHSASPTSEAATALVEATRQRVLAFLHADPSEYVAIFTPNATGAARLVGEAYRFSRRRRLVLTADNHNSLNGLREYARRAGARTTYIPSTAPDLLVDPTALDAALPRRGRSCWLPSWATCFGGEEEVSNPGEHPHDRGLFAYPAQSNFSGVRHPLAWVAEAQSRGYDVLLDAAAYLPTAPLDLSAVHPDFVTISWYKLFGYPTGVGCLVARRAALARLDRPWFSGGTIRAASVQLDWHAPATRPEAQFEDGTVSFQALPDVAAGLDWLEAVGRDRIQTRTRCLTGWFLDRLLALRHANGQPMAVLYGPPTCDSKVRGATVAFNFVDPRGRVVDDRIVAADAAAHRLSLRTGCFCNPGAGEIALGLSRADLRLLQKLQQQAHDHAGYAPQAAMSASSLSSGDLKAELKAQPTSPVHPDMPISGAVRVSFGIASNTADVDRFFAFAESTYRDRLADHGFLLPRHEC